MTLLLIKFVAMIYDENLFSSYPRFNRVERSEVFSEREGKGELTESNSAQAKPSRPRMDG